MGLNQATFMTSAIPKILVRVLWMAGVGIWNRQPSPRLAENHHSRPKATRDEARETIVRCAAHSVPFLL